MAQQAPAAAVALPPPPLCDRPKVRTAKPRLKRRPRVPTAKPRLKRRFLRRGLADYLLDVQKIPSRVIKLPGIIGEIGFQGLHNRIVAHGRNIDAQKGRKLPSDEE